MYQTWNTDRPNNQLLYRQSDIYTDKQAVSYSTCLCESVYAAEEFNIRIQLKWELYFGNRDFQSIHPKNMNVCMFMYVWMNVLLAPETIEISMGFIYGTWKRLNKVCT